MVSVRVVRVSRWGSCGGLLAVRYIFNLGRREMGRISARAQSGNTHHTSYTNRENLK